MAKPISTKVHGILDYITVGAMFALPRLLGANRALTNAVSGIAISKLGYAMLSKHEMAAMKLIPMPAHLTLDAIEGAALCTLPFALDEDNGAAQAGLLGLGLFDIVAAPLTQTQMRRPKPPKPTTRPIALGRDPRPASLLPAGLGAERGR